MKKIFLNSDKIVIKYTEKIKHTIKVFKSFLHILVIYITIIATFNRFIISFISKIFYLFKQRTKYFQIAIKS